MHVTAARATNLVLLTLALVHGQEAAAEVAAAPGRMEMQAPRRWASVGSAPRRTCHLDIPDDVPLRGPPLKPGKSLCELPRATRTPAKNPKNFNAVVDYTRLRAGGDPTNITDDQKLNKTEIASMAADYIEVAGGFAPRDGTYPRVFCALYTTHNHRKLSLAANDTWLKRCDGFAMFDDEPDPALHGFRLPGEPFTYKSLPQKTSWALRTMYRWVRTGGREPEELSPWRPPGLASDLRPFDFVILSDTDSYTVVDNLKHYLRHSPDVRAAEERGGPLYIGRRFFRKGNESAQYNAGGAYVFNVKAIEALGEALENISSTFDNQEPRLTTTGSLPAKQQPNGCVKLYASYGPEDAFLGECYHHATGELPLDTRDAAGRERFHAMNPQSELHGGWSDAPVWYAKFSVEPKEGYMSLSPHSIQFHFIKDAQIRTLHAALYPPVSAPHT